MGLFGVFLYVVVQLPTPGDPMDGSMTPGLPAPNFAKFISINFVMPSNHLILCLPLLLLTSIFPRNRVFSNESDVFL